MEGLRGVRSKNLHIINLIALSERSYIYYMENAHEVLKILENSNIESIRGIKEHPHSKEFLNMLSSHTTIYKD